MRLLHSLLLLPLLGAPAFAQSAATAPTEHHGRRTAAQHFADANTTHDGHLTREQAQVGYKTIAKSFDQIDVEHHGYVTVDDIKAWRAAKRAARKAAKHTSADATGIIRPLPTAQPFAPPKASNTSSDSIVPAPMQHPRTGVDLPKAPLDTTHPS